MGGGGPRDLLISSRTAHPTEPPRPAYKHMTHWGMASLEPSGLFGRIYVGDCGPHGFREEDFSSFSHYKSMGANDPRGIASLGPRSLIGRIYVGNHQALLHTKYMPWTSRFLRFF